jgi:hypothetical protein
MLTAKIIEAAGPAGAGKEEERRRFFLLSQAALTESGDFAEPAGVIVIIR